MTDEKVKASVPHNVREIEELRADRELANEYFKATIEALSNPADWAAGLAALGTLTKLIAEEGDVKPLTDIYRTWIALAHPLRTLNWLCGPRRPVRASLF